MNFLQTKMDKENDKTIKHSTGLDYLCTLVFHHLCRLIDQEAQKR